MSILYGACAIITKASDQRPIILAGRQLYDTIWTFSTVFGKQISSIAKILMRCVLRHPKVK